MASTSSSSPPSWADPTAVARVVITVVAVVAAIGLIYVLRQPLTWLFLAAFLAIAVSGPIAWFSRFMPRGPAIAITYVLLLLVPVSLLLAIVPSIVTGVDSLVEAGPKYAADAQNWVETNTWLRGLEQDYGLLSSLQDKLRDLPQYMGSAASRLGDFGLGLVSSGFAVLNIVLMSMFLVGGGPRWTRSLLAKQSPARAERIQRVLEGVGSAVGNYVMGAIAQALIAGVTTYIVLVILGVPYAVGLAAITFVLDLIPLVGATIGAVVVGIVTVFTGFPTTTIVWVVYAVVYQQIENNVIQPQIQRRAVAIEPIVVLVAVLCGATIAGVLGAVLAIPVAASLQTVFREVRAMYAESKGDGAGGGGADGDGGPADGVDDGAVGGDGVEPAPA